MEAQGYGRNDQYYSQQGQRDMPRGGGGGQKKSSYIDSQQTSQGYYQDYSGGQGDGYNDYAYDQQTFQNFQYNPHGRR